MHVNNQFDNFLKNYDPKVKETSQEDYIVGFGLFSFMEVQGRLSESKKYHRDLSANFKLQLPYHHKYLPNIAVGMQDLGGAASNYDNQYVVLDKEILFTRVSLGYGHSTITRTKRKRMDGLFGALEVQATPWLYFMAEHDSVEKQIALRLETPKSWIKEFNIRATLARNIQTNTLSMAFMLDIPLYHESKVSHQEVFLSQRKLVYPATKHIVKTTGIKYKNPIQSIQELQKHLSQFGFENVRVGYLDKRLYIQVENSIFEHTDLDAIGYVLGIISTSELEYKTYTLTLLKNNLKTMSISGDIQYFKNYLLQASAQNRRLLQENLQFDRDFDDSNITYSAKKHSSFFIPRVELSLGLNTTVGTEFGVLDYIASLRTNVYMNIYDGLVVSIMSEIPFANSSDFDTGKIYYDKTKMTSRVVNAMLHQTLHYKNIFNTLSVGKYKTHYVGALNQANFTTTSGKHALMLRSGYFVDTRNSLYPTRKTALFSYRYNYAPMDIYLQVKYGRFWYGDVGGEFEFKRFFGETAVSFYYKNTSILYADNSKAKEQFAGIKISFPLTTRKLYRANYIQFKGKKDWSYALSSTINKADGTNSLNNNFGITPLSDLELTTQYLDRDRLNASYIRNHLDRVREAFLQYKILQIKMVDVSDK